jgi:hypothetical protein
MATKADKQDGPTPGFKIPFRDLEEARRDPVAYRRRRDAEPDGSGFGIKSRHQLLVRAVAHYHKRRGDLLAARRYLEDGYAAAQYSSQKELSGLVDQLVAYDSEYRALRNRGYYALKTKDRVELPLPTQYQGKFRVSGEVSRLDMSPNGHALWMFAKETANAHNDLRLPLLLNAYPPLLNSLFDELEIGVYDFSCGRHHFLIFSELQVKAAQEELETILTAMSAP